MKVYHQRAARKKHACHATGGGAGKGRVVFENVSQAFREPLRGARDKWELGRVAPYQGKHCMGSHGDLNTCPNNLHSLQQRFGRYMAYMADVFPKRCLEAVAKIE